MAIKEIISKKISKKTIKEPFLKNHISKIFQDYEKYRWFITSTNKLVIGGKNAEQNEEIVKKIVKENKKYIIMHTKEPGSPFTIIIKENPVISELDECARFTASYSRAWREGKKKADVDIFLSEQIEKEPGMKLGSFKVIGPVDRKKVEIKLWFTKQKEKLRCVPFKVDKSSCIIPGKIPKDKFAEQISIKLNTPKEEVLNALPSGGFKISE